MTLFDHCTKSGSNKAHQAHSAIAYLQQLQLLFEEYSIASWQAALKNSHTISMKPALSSARLMRGSLCSQLHLSWPALLSIEVHYYHLAPSKLASKEIFPVLCLLYLRKKFRIPKHVTRYLSAYAAWQFYSRAIGDQRIPGRAMWPFPELSLS